MDDSLEKPTSLLKPVDPTPEEDEESSGDEDQGPDWTRLLGGVARPVIPKRGEKDFEPIAAGGSGLQRHVLDRSRNAMFDALRATPAISNKSVSHAIWYPELGRAHVTVARGIHFTNMGHSVSRPSMTDEGAKQTQKRLELLPEEALYLVERGAMFCWKASELQFSGPIAMDNAGGVPMSVQQAFAEMIGKEDLTLEKYQVFAYLRRLGYVVMRAKPPTADYPVPTPPAVKARPGASILGLFYAGFQSVVSRMSRLFPRSLDWWKPLRINRWLRSKLNDASIFKSLRFVQSGFDIPVNAKQRPDAARSPYEVFYHLYKPSTPFKKTAPPLPDYSFVVVNARTTPMPSLFELTALFGELPELPPPVPRKRISLIQQKQEKENAGPADPHPLPSPPPLPLWHKLLSWGLPAGLPPSSPPRKTNPFLALKTGKKMVVIAAVDAGTTSFFRFGQGVFEEWPMQ